MTHDEIISKKNTLAFQQTLKDQAALISALQEQLQSLTSTVNTLMLRLDSLQQVNHVQKAMMFGHGPSSRD
jgi:prefoldin subunit 5